MPLIYCLLSPNQVDPLLLDPGQLHISRLTPLQNMKCIQIKCKIHQKRKHYNIHFLRTPFFLMCIRSILWWILPGAHHLSCRGYLFSTSSNFERREMNEQTNTYFLLRPISFQTMLKKGEIGSVHSMMVSMQPPFGSYLRSSFFFCRSVGSGRISTDVSVTKKRYRMAWCPLLSHFHLYWTRVPSVWLVQSSDTLTFPSVRTPTRPLSEFCPL